MSWDTWLLGADVHQRSSCLTTGELISSTLSPVFSFVGHGDKHLQMLSKFNVRPFPWNWRSWIVAIQTLKCPLPLKRECVAIFFIPSCPSFRYWHLQDSLVVRTTYHPTTPILRLLNLQNKHLLLVTWRSLIPFYGQFTTCMKRLIQLAAMTALNYSNCATK